MSQEKIPTQDARLALTTPAPLHPLPSPLLCPNSLPLSQAGQHVGSKENSESALLCYVEEVLTPPQILFSFISLWFTPLCVCIFSFG